MTGRYYHPVETYKTEDADTLLVTMGSCSETASVAVDKMREREELLAREDSTLATFSFDDFKKATLHAKQLVVIDRAMSLGACGPVASEVKAAFMGRTTAIHL